MKNFLTFIAAMIPFLFTSPSYAAKVYQCKDEEGNITFQDMCPPGTMSVGEKKYGSEKKEPGESGNAEISATVYRVPVCPSCEQIKDFLQARNIPFTEKDVNENLELQTELKGKTGNEELKVPVTIIGENVIIGYDRQQLLATLKDAGYTEPQSEEAEQED